MNTHQIYNDSKMAEVHRYLGHILSYGLWNLLAGQDGLAYIISDIVVLDGYVESRLIDGTSFTCSIPAHIRRQKAK